MPEARQRWRMRPVLEKTWQNSCLHFQQFANDRDEVQTAGGAGFVANHIELTLAANADALSHLNTQMANLGVTNTTQAATILDLTTRLAAATATHQAYRDSSLNYRPRNSRSTNNNEQTHHGAPPAGPRLFPSPASTAGHMDTALTVAPNAVARALVIKPPPLSPIA